MFWGAAPEGFVFGAGSSAPDRVGAPGTARRVSRLGLTLTFSLLGSLLAWRLWVPSPPPWLDAILLAAVGIVLLVVRARVRGR